MGVQTSEDEHILDYRPRVADGELAALLRATGAVVVEGPRACGKTETAMRAAASAVRLDVDDAARAAGLLSPSLLLDGPRPRLIDEWQLVPGVWNHVRRAIDDTGGRPGQFVLTGSAVPSDDATRHSGAGRFSRLRMRPMTLFEAGRSTGDASLAALLAGDAPRTVDPGLDIRDIASLVAVGGWPALLERSVDEALAAVRGYLDETRRSDLARADGIARDPENVGRVLRSLARHVGTQVSARSIAADVGGAEGPVDNHTVLAYMAALSRVFVVEDLPAWSPALRSRTPLRHFADPSLAVAALGADPDRLLRDVATLGLLFESLVVRDLRVLAQAIGATVSHYRDGTGLEADAVVELRDGTWAAFEVKLGPGAVDDGARSLQRLADRVDARRHGRPAALVVVTGWGYGYRRQDGVCVVPAGSLGP
jgi:predicted AAA+ superfamily ATPase